MNPMFKDLLDALKEGDLDKITNAIFSITRLQEPSEEKEGINYHFIAPGKPLFVTGQIIEIENYVIKTIEINLYYPGWILSILVYDKETVVDFSYSVEPGMKLSISRE